MAEDKAEQRADSASLVLRIPRYSSFAPKKRQKFLLCALVGTLVCLGLPIFLPTALVWLAVIAALIAYRHAVYMLLVKAGYDWCSLYGVVGQGEKRLSTLALLFLIPGTVITNILLLFELGLDVNLILAGVIWALWPVWLVGLSYAYKKIRKYGGQAIAQLDQCLAQKC